jgi:hypothetical protein
MHYLPTGSRLQRGPYFFVLCMVQLWEWKTTDPLEEAGLDRAALTKDLSAIRAWADLTLWRQVKGENGRVRRGDDGDVSRSRVMGGGCGNRIRSRIERHGVNTFHGSCAGYCALLIAACNFYRCGYVLECLTLEFHDHTQSLTLVASYSARLNDDVRSRKSALLCVAGCRGGCGSDKDGGTEDQTESTCGNDCVSHTESSHEYFSDYLCFTWWRYRLIPEVPPPSCESQS